ncbi:DUF4082 domain-containing protein [Nostocaceae cyanobacterium CENA357]|uniref:DUF4082 domain-containing protein n=1 Tax=Atlanticothrix silvestris CENA357 TaxID=1725252 RepID=A0A8J7L6J2_9CYAN|nr:DUF4082 domain-containing protein [Atlanticothrix silvestris]MBH8555782.1 DUF4082 domain-containing protein [Atlanticothrix silvestris CENA357]
MLTAIEPSFIDYPIGENSIIQDIKLFNDKDPRFDGVINGGSPSSVSGDDKPYNAGFKFKSSQAGKIKALRSWISAQDNINQIHKARLWDGETKQLLAEVEFENIVGDAWNEAALNPPIDIQANKIYIVSADVLKNLPRQGNFFATSFVKGPITALATTESTNGVFAYYNLEDGYDDPALAPVFPERSFQNSYYYQDIVFQRQSELITFDLFNDKDPRFDGVINGGSPSSVSGDDKPYNAGFKFKSSQAGKIKALRSWISAQDNINQIHKARLWDGETKQLLAEVEFENIVGDAWNEAALNPPIDIQANKIYIVSADVLKNLPRQGNFFATSFVKGPITALATTESTNGVFAYYNLEDGYDDPALAPVFPERSFQNSYYYQDILFQTKGDSTNLNVREHVVNHPIFLENLKPGTENWLETNYASGLEIAAFMSAESINKGESIDIKANVLTPGDIRVEVYRLGYYGGVGGRLVQTADNISAIKQSISNELVDSQTQLVRYNWAKTYTITTNDTWVTGCYMVKLTDKNTNKQCLAFFILRDDALESDVIYKFGFATHLAYNTFSYDGANRKSTYSGGERALQITHDRPWVANTFDIGIGNSNPLRWEVNTIRWLEKNSYRISYCGGQDIDKQGSNLVKKYRVFMNSGHDEYWSFNEYKAIKEAIEAGVNVVSLSANTCYWNIKWDTDYRTADLYKKNDPLAGGVVDNYIEDTFNIPPTYRFRDQELLGKTFDGCQIKGECGLLGVGYIGDIGNIYGGYDLTVKKEDNLFRGTGLTVGSKLSKLLGYEWDHIDPDPLAQPQIKMGTPNFLDSIIFESTIPDSIPGSSNIYQSFLGELPSEAVQTAHGVYFTAPSGAKVFSVGSIQTSWGLDSWGVSPARESTAYQRVIYNVFEDMGVWGGYPAPISVQSIKPTMTRQLSMKSPLTPKPHHFNSLLHQISALLSEVTDEKVKSNLDLALRQLGYGNYEAVRTHLNDAGYPELVSQVPNPPSIKE